MRIVWVVPGGVARGDEHHVIPALHWLMARLADRHDLHVVVPRQEPRPDSWILHGAEVHNLGARRWRIPALRRLLELDRERRLDVIQALWGSGPAEVAWIAARLRGRPLAVHLGGGELVWLPELAFGAARAWRRSLTRFVVRRADLVTAPSTSMMELGASIGARPVRLPLGIDTRFWIPQEPRPRDEDRPARLVQVASLTPVKGQAVLLRAVRALTVAGWRVHLDLVGEDTLGGSLQRLAEELDIRQHVTFHGFLPQRSVISIVRNAHIMVVSSFHEAGPVAMLEAAAVAVPTVGTAVGLVKDWSPNAAIAVPVGDGDALAHEIAGLLSNDPRRLEIGRSAQRLALQEDADWTAERFETHYAELTREGHRV